MDFRAANKWQHKQQKMAKLKKQETTAINNASIDLIVRMSDDNNTTYIDEVIVGDNQENVCVAISGSLSNCKLTTIDRVNRLMNFDEPIFVRLFTRILKRYARQIVSITIARTDHMELIKRNFRCLNIFKIPFGDDNQQQYHMLLATDRLQERYDYALKENGVEQIYSEEKVEGFKAPDEKNKIQYPWMEAPEPARGNMTMGRHTDAIDRAIDRLTEGDFEQIVTETPEREQQTPLEEAFHS